LVLDRDYTIVPVGGTEHRMEALKDGRAAAAVMSAPTDLEAKEQGYNILADAAAELGGYQGSVYGVRRRWAQDNEATMLAFVRAITEAHERIFADKAVAVETLRSRIKGLDDKGAETIYTGLTMGKGGLARRAEINVAGVASVLSMRSAYAEPKKVLSDPQKYLDLSYYKKAHG
jgi:ABC-type nitrate/sulfonate/bicarbonate transport system substrate-binding protein